MIVTDRMVDEDFFFNETFVEKKNEKKKIHFTLVGIDI